MIGSGFFELWLPDAPTPIGHLLRLPTEASAEWKFHDIVGHRFVNRTLPFQNRKTFFWFILYPKEVKYDQGHIPTAINIPDSHFEKYDISAAPG